MIAKRSEGGVERCRQPHVGAQRAGSIFAGHGRFFERIHVDVHVELGGQRVRFFFASDPGGDARLAQASTWPSRLGHVQLGLGSRVSPMAPARSSESPGGA